MTRFYCVVIVLRILILATWVPLLLGFELANIAAHLKQESTRNLFCLAAIEKVWP